MDFFTHCRHTDEKLEEMSYLEVVSKKFDSRFSKSDLNLDISSSIFLISSSKRSRIDANSVSMTLKLPNLTGISRLIPLSAIVVVVVLTFGVVITGKKIRKI